jgi:beta-glucosidase/6-phospho-beta-glucosidase/beta-galactosidase
MGWNIVPKGLGDMLLWISERYDNPLIFITENGSAEKEVDLNEARTDAKRLLYFKTHLKVAGDAIKNNGVHLAGYFAWSFMDNFEWQFGFQRRFGMCWVDYKTLERTPKSSAIWYSETIARNGANIL